MTEITILIPVRNGEKFLGDAMESVLGQTFARWRLVVSDNASTDGTRDIVRRRLSDPRVRLMESETNLGMVANFNKCLDSIETKYYCLLCHDDFLYSPRALESAYAVMEANPDVAAVYSDLAFVRGDRTLIMMRRYGRHGRVDPARLVRRSILQTRNLFGIPLLVRTSALDELRYDPALPYTLDLDLSIAMANRGVIFYLPEPLIGNRYHGKSQTTTLFRGLRSEMAALARKHDISLGRSELAFMRAAACCSTIFRQAFLIYAGRQKARPE